MTYDSKIYVKIFLIAFFIIIAVIYTLDQLEIYIKQQKNMPYVVYSKYNQLGYTESSRLNNGSCIVVYPTRVINKNSTKTIICDNNSIIIPAK